jgi:hypothetical protein
MKARVRARKRKKAQLLFENRLYIAVNNRLISYGKLKG